MDDRVGSRPFGAACPRGSETVARIRGRAARRTDRSPWTLRVLAVLASPTVLAADPPGAGSGAYLSLGAIAFPLVLLAGMIALLELGRHLGRRRLARDLEGARAGLGAVEGAMFALLGLLIAFTFSGAAGRFEARRQLIVQEANNLGTAWSRLDLLPAERRPALREQFRAYVDARIAVYERIPDVESARAELDRSIALQGTIWTQAVAACETPEGQRATMLLLPALNAMFDIVTDRTAALRTHPPLIIFAMLGALALASSLLAGLGMAGSKRRSWFHVLGYPLILAGCVYVIMDLEFPRVGFIRIDAVDQLLVDVRKSMD